MKCRHLGLVFVLAIGVSGCPSTQGAPTAKCTQLNAQCKLPDGPLGVCTDTACGDGSESGCMECTSQH